MLDFGFEIPPFGVTPDRRMVFLHKQFADAYSALEDGILSGKGFIVVTGEIGAGKTTLLRSFLADEHPDLETAVILNTGLDADGLLRAIAEDLGIKIKETFDRKKIIDALNSHLLDTFSKGKQTAIFIDEAQNLNFESLEVLRMLSNLETETDKLLQIVLFGQNDLRDTLAKPELLQLRSRIAVHKHLKPLELNETKNYIIHRLSVAQPSIPINFTDASIKRLQRASGGVPRVINILAGIALDAASEEDVSSVEAEHVRIAEDEFKYLEPPAAVDKKPFRFLTVIAWILVVAVIVMIGLRFRKPETFVQVQSHQIAVAASETSKVIALFLNENGIALKHDTSVLDSIRESALARSYGREWVEIPSDMKLLNAVGLPALVPIGREGKRSFAVLTWTDTQGIAKLVRAEGSLLLYADEIALDTGASSSILLPLDIKLPYFMIGDQGEAISKLQQALTSAGCYNGELNGIFDYATRDAVIKFQVENRLPIDGLVGPWTVGSFISKGLWQNY